jgi:hypothetical protein
VNEEAIARAGPQRKKKEGKRNLRQEKQNCNCTESFVEETTRNGTYQLRCVHIRREILKEVLKNTYQLHRHGKN